MEKKKIILSIALAVYNEEKNIDSCLQSVSEFADEIVLVDGGSHDKTLTIAQKYNARIIQTDNPPIFHINKQKALEACFGDWILQLDADEVVTKELQEEILRVTSHESRVNGYYIPRKNYFWGHWMRKGGQYPDYVIRLVRKGKARFPCRSVHEQIEVDGTVDYFIHPMLHYSYQTRADYWKKADVYTNLTAQELAKSKTNQFILFFQYCFVKPIGIFLSIYFRHKGFMDGLTGFEFSLYSGLHFPIAFIKSIKL